MRIMFSQKISAAFQTLYRQTSGIQGVCLFADGRGGREGKGRRKIPSSYTQTKRKRKKEDAREKRVWTKGVQLKQPGEIIQPFDKTFRRAIVTVVGEVLVRLFGNIVRSRKTCESAKTCLSLKSQTPGLLRIKLIVRKTPSS